MARRKVGKITKVLNGIESYSYLMNGVAGIGKTTTVCEIGQKKFGIDGFLLMTIGSEPEPSHIGNLWNVVINDWEELESTIDELIEYKDTDYKDLKMIGFDSIGEIFRLAEEEVIREYNKTQDSGNKVKTINGAYGGFYRGNLRAIEIVIQLINKVEKAGYSRFFIGHTKQKNNVDALTGIEYQQITSDVESRYFNVIKDRVNIVMCAYMDREIVDISEVTKKFKNQEKKIKVGDIASEKRVVSFRDESYSIDLKCHLKHMVDKCDLDSDVIIKELEEAIQKQIDDFGGKSETKEEVLKERTQIKNKELSIETKTEIIDKVKANLSKIEIADLKAIMTKYDFTDFNDVEAIPAAAFKEIEKLI